ncbi:MAG: hypothetical protein DRG40_00410 [Deltaproteobacteria bacterium]|nr:MAG: hypothetical protein DRG40_00410 [Deltaproteobacteria bacterium]
MFRGKVAKSTSVIKRISEALHTISSVALAFTFLYIVTDVILRFLKLRPIGDVVEATGYLNVWICFLGTGFLVREGSHIRVDLIISRLSSGKRHVIRVVTDLATVTFCLIMLYKGIDLVAVTYHLGTRTPSWEFLIWPLQIVVPVGFLCFLLETLSNLAVTISRKGSRDGI